MHWWLALCMFFAWHEADAQGGFFGEIRAAREMHDRGVQGEKEAVLEAVRMLEDMLAEEPGNELVRVYLGSALTLLARDLPPGPEKLAKLIEGGRLMDEAVAAAPEDLRVRFVRAVNHYHLPALFGKKRLARSELLVVNDGINTGAEKLEPVEEQSMRYFAGRAMADLGRKKEAVHLLRVALALAPDSALAGEISEHLERLSR